MSVAAAGPPAPGARIRRHLWDRVPLRVKLVAALAGLLALALGVIGVGSVVAVRDYMIARVDHQLDPAMVTAKSARAQQVTFIPPSDFVIAYPDPFREGMIRILRWEGYTDQDLPDFSAVFTNPTLDEPFTVPARNRSRQWRVLATSLDSGGIMVVGEDLSAVDNAIRRLTFANLLVGLGVLGLLASAGIWIVRQSLRPLVEIERTAAAIAGGDLTKRVPELDPGTELGQLSASLNTMLSQIESAFQARAESQRRAQRSEERMREFVADASHELRTPLTTIRGFAELYRQGAAPDPAEVLSRIEDEAARMGLLVEDLLLLARLDQHRPLSRNEVALARIIDDAAAAAAAIAPDRPIDVEVDEPDGPLLVQGDEARLRQVVDNLVSNALTHTPAGTAVGLRLFGVDGHAVIEVADTGPGLAPEQAARVFERFYRVDKARTRRAAAGRRAPAGIAAHTGTGLGLAIVAALVAAHQGVVEVDTAPGKGATFRVRLPLARSGPPPSQPEQ